MDDKNPAPAAPTGTTPPPMECKLCGKPGRLYNLCGQDELLCEDDYERRLSMYNDFGSN